MPDAQLSERFYRSLYRIRRVEEEIARLYHTDKIKSPVHLSIGQEAVSVGVCEALRPRDIIFGTYRGHAMYLAKGGDLRKMIAELYGKATGCTGGMGGSMHLIGKEKGVMGTSAIVGTTIPVAVGYALGQQYLKSGVVTVSFFGDGAVDEGAFHESMNFAAIKNIPVIFVCENNSYAIHSHHLSRHHSDNICERVMSYGIPAARFAEDDIFAIHEFTRAAVEKISRGAGGPIFLECLTCRWKEHVGPGEDFDLGYRSREEVACRIENDPLRECKSLLPPDVSPAIECEIENEIQEAFQFAEESPFPDGKEAYRNLFKD
ncbi:MAG: thiamine pyrophosphate-dependent dehydrogenase E1 component subunit alpha [Syntrophales bacterium LBB04]|nr:thiamine pyrophosphate-dependent dehydrogenase E1 component subunit alpha [Syntrophales bacterium LBB04]